MRPNIFSNSTGKQHPLVAKECIAKNSCDKTFRPEGISLFYLSSTLLDLRPQFFTINVSIFL